MPGFLSADCTTGWVPDPSLDELLATLELPQLVPEQAAAEAAAPEVRSK